ncbi:MAG: hypothetical protein KC420_09975, partial [Myxococcales bacterium]|nr:hypothetical protein [Myxococcales bacterium]MCB9567031.1 hypothetical protein [Myxococcales bacterium]MCB9704098.1 hypothetical protein [Myxococcales bacterium]
MIRRRHLWSASAPLALALAVAGCTKKEEEKPKAEASAGESAGAGEGAGAGAGEGPASPADVKVPDVAVPGGDRFSHEGVLGHVALPNASKLITDVRTQLVNPQYQNVVDENALRSLVSLSLDKQGMVAQNIDLQTPLGCAVVDFKTFEVPLACTFGYRGGIKALLNDLGDFGRKPDNGGHAAIYLVEGKEVYVDELGDHLVVAAHPDLYDRTKGYLKGAIIDRGPAMAGDLEFVGYLGEIWSKYQADIEPFLAMMDQASQVPQQTGNAKLDAAMAKWVEYNTKSTRQSINRLAQYEQVTAYLSIAPYGVALGATMVPAAGSEAESEAKAFGGRAIDPAFVKALPAGSWMIATFNTDPKAMDTKTVQEVRDLAIDTWAELAGLDKEATRASVISFQEEGRRLYDGLGAFAVFDQEGAPFALEIAQHLRPGISARDTWKTWSAKFTPESVLGAEFSKFVTWEFTADALSVDGVPVDRWVIRPSKEVEAEIAKKMSEDPNAKALVERYWGPLQVTIDRAETGGAVLYTIAPKAEEAAIRRVISAQKGEGSLSGDAGLAAVLGRSEGAAGIVAFDGKALLDWLRGFPEVSKELSKMPGVLGTNLGDVYLVTRYLQSGVSSFEYVVSQQLIDQIKAMIDKAG